MSIKLVKQYDTNVIRSERSSVIEIGAGIDLTQNETGLPRLDVVSSAVLVNTLADPTEFVAGTLRFEGALLQDNSGAVTISYDARFIQPSALSTLGQSSIHAGNITAGVLAVARGGTGLGSAGNAGNVLRSDGSSWASTQLAFTDLSGISNIPSTVVNNTWTGVNRYLNPGTTVLRYYPNVYGETQNTTVAGAWVVNTPIGRGANEMFKIRVHGYLYSSSDVLDFTVVCYGYNGSLGEDGVAGNPTNMSLIDNGNDGSVKRIGVNASGNIAVSFGEHTDSRYYGRISVDLWTSLQTSDYTSGWSIEQATVAGFGWLDTTVLSYEILDQFIGSNIPRLNLSNIFTTVQSIRNTPGSPFLELWPSGTPTSTSTNGEVRFWGDAAKVSPRYAWIAQKNSGGLNQNDLAFGTNYASTNVEVMRLWNVNSAPHVGIGVSDGVDTLNVGGSLGVTGVGSFGGTLTVLSGAGTRVAVGNPTTSAPAMTIGRVSGQPNIKSSLDWLIMDSNTQPAAINYYATQNVYLAFGGGSVGIGQASAAFKLDVNGSARFKNNGQTLRLDGTSSAYLSFFREGTSRTAYVGHGTSGSNLFSFHSDAGDGFSFSSAAASQIIDFNNLRLTALAPPIDWTDAATKGYVDSVGSSKTQFSDVWDNFLVVGATVTEIAGQDFQMQLESGIAYTSNVTGQLGDTVTGRRVRIINRVIDATQAPWAAVLAGGLSPQDDFILYVSGGAENPDTQTFDATVEMLRAEEYDPDIYGDVVLALFTYQPGSTPTATRGFSNIRTGKDLNGYEPTSGSRPNIVDPYTAKMYAYVDTTSNGLNSRRAMYFADDNSFWPALTGMNIGRPEVWGNRWDTVYATSIDLATSMTWSTITGGWHQFTTPSGYIRLGPANTTYAHIYTDRPAFYFNAPIRVLGTLVSLEGHTHTVADIAEGGTFSGDLSIVKNNAWFSLDSASTGGNGVEQGAGISIGESGYKGSAAMHLTYTGDGFGHFGMGTVDPVTGIPAFRGFRMNYQSTTVHFDSMPTVGGAGLDFIFAEDGHTHSAANITSGQLTVSRGGTGRESFTAGHVLLGAGGNPITALAPGSDGGYLRSNGTAWVRSTIASSDIPAHNHIASQITSGTFTNRLGWDAPFVRGMTDPAWQVGYNVVRGHVQNSAAAGAIVIKTGVRTGDASSMFTIRIEGRLHATSAPVEVTVTGYAQTTGVISNHSHTYHSKDFRPTLRLARDIDGYLCIIFGDVGDTWSYPRIFVPYAGIGYSGSDALQWDGWSVDMQTDLSSFTDIVTSADESNAQYLNGETGAFYLNPANLTSAVPVNKGGTGRTSLTSGALLVGAGVSAIGHSLVPPALSGEGKRYFLVSNGLIWTPDLVSETDLPSLEEMVGDTIDTVGADYLVVARQNSAGQPVAYRYEAPGVIMGLDSAVLDDIGDVEFEQVDQAGLVLQRHSLVGGGFEWRARPLVDANIAALDFTNAALAGKADINHIHTRLDSYREDGVSLGPYDVITGMRLKFAESSQLASPPGTGSFRHLMQIQTWTTYSSSYPTYQVSFGNGAIGVRQATSLTTWGSWRTVAEEAWVSSGFSPLGHTHNAATDLTGILASARLSGVYSGITGVGILNGLEVGGAGLEVRTIHSPAGYLDIAATDATYNNGIILRRSIAITSNWTNIGMSDASTLFIGVNSSASGFKIRGDGDFEGRNGLLLGSFIANTDITARTGGVSGVVLGRHPAYPTYAALWKQGNEATARYSILMSDGDTYVNAPLSTGGVYLRRANLSMLDVTSVAATFYVPPRYDNGSTDYALPVVITGTSATPPATTGLPQGTFYARY